MIFCGFSHKIQEKPNEMIPFETIPVDGVVVIDSLLSIKNFVFYSFTKYANDLNESVQFDGNGVYLYGCAHKSNIYFNYKWVIWLSQEIDLKLCSVHTHTQTRYEQIPFHHIV